MPQSVVATLLFFAALGFAGAGAAFAGARSRELEEGGVDAGLRTVALLFASFGAACIFVSGGFSGIIAFGGVIAWASYVIAAQKLGIFRIEDSYIGAHDPRRPHVVQRDF